MNVQIENRQRLTIVFSLIFIIILFLVIKNYNNKYILDEFNGTFSVDNSRLVLVIDKLNNNTFYYYDYDNSLYLKGKYKVYNDNTYYLSDNKHVIDQYVIYENLSFTISINNNQLTFRKIGNNPIIDQSVNDSP